MYTGPQAGAQRALEVICIVLLAVFAAGDAWHALALARKSRFGELLGFGALLDWGHWALMAYAWWMWYANVTEVAGFTMMTQPDYWVLANPIANARMFLTNATTEANFLRLHQAVTGYLFGAAETYNALVSCSVVLFVIRVLRSFEFQARPPPAPAHLPALQIHPGVVSRGPSARLGSSIYTYIILQYYI